MKFPHPFLLVLVLTFCVANAFAFEELRPKAKNPDSAAVTFVASGKGVYELSVWEKIESKSVLYTGGTYTFYIITSGLVLLSIAGFLKSRHVNVVLIDPGPEEGLQGLRQHRA